MDKFLSDMIVFVMDYPQVFMIICFVSAAWVWWTYCARKTEEERAILHRAVELSLYFGYVDAVEYNQLRHMLNKVPFEQHFRASLMGKDTRRLYDYTLIKRISDIVEHHNSVNRRRRAF